MSTVKNVYNSIIFYFSDIHLETRFITCKREFLTEGFDNIQIDHKIEDSDQIKMVFAQWIFNYISLCNQWILMSRALLFINCQQILTILWNNLNETIDWWKRYNQTLIIHILDRWLPVVWRRNLGNFSLWNLFLQSEILSYVLFLFIHLNITKLKMRILYIITLSFFCNCL